MTGSIARAAWAGVFVVAAGLACGGPAAERTERTELPPEELKPRDEEARLKIEKRETAVREIEAAGTRGPRLASEVGELGRLYQSYNLGEAALLCYREAARIDPGDYRWTYLEGYLHHRDGELEEATVDYLASLEKRGWTPAVLHRAADVELQRGSVDAAEAHWRRALEERQDFAAAYHGLGQVATARGEISTAVELFARAVAIEPGVGRGQHSLGMAYRDAGDEDQALAHLALGGESAFPLDDPLVEGIAALRSGSQALVESGLEARRTGDPMRAIAAFREAVAQDPENRVAHHNLALSLSEAALDNEAIVAYRRLLELDGSEPSYHSALATLVARAGRFEAALPHWERAVELAPDFKQARFDMATALERLGRFDEALIQYEAVVEFDPDFAEIHSKRAIALAATDRPDEAERLLVERLSAVPADAKSAVALSAILRFSNRVEEAADVLASSLEAGLYEAPIEGELRLELGRALALLSRYDEALPELQAARELAPDLPEAALLEGALWIERGRLDRAESSFRTAVQRDPRHLQARGALAEVLERQGRCSEAVRLLEEGARLVPDPALEQALAQLRRRC